MNLWQSVWNFAVHERFGYYRPSRITVADLDERADAVAFRREM